MELFEGRLSTHSTQAYPLVHASGDAGAAIVPLLIAHEMWHGFQHHMLDRLACQQARPRGSTS